MKYRSVLLSVLWIPLVGPLVAAGQTPADQPAPRTDENSRQAHRDLLEKARQGAMTAKIDVYFVGDSITRRWGCTDPQYRELLEHWRQTFHGWNAANFAWGGDTTRNILWRLENGELDGLAPKVFVILVGTNNIASNPAESDPAEIARGVRAIIDTCQRKVPEAKIVLTALFPRDNKPGAGAIVQQVNERIADFADGERVRWVNINDQLTDDEGNLRDGMMPDGLHPSLEAYDIWAAALKPLLTEWLGPPGEEDHAPPPTGDPSAVRE